MHGGIIQVDLRVPWQIFHPGAPVRGLGQGQRELFMQ